MSLLPPEAQIDQVRAFNRYYTRRVGLLQEHLPGGPYPLTHARVLFELAQRQPVAARNIGDALGLDAGYLSRILHGFVADGLVERTRSQQDGRSFELRLTPAGAAVFAGLDRHSREATAAMLAELSEPARRRLLRGLSDVQHALSPNADASGLVIRPHAIGDIGWAIERHGRLYYDEYGWNAEFEALVATLFARFASRHDPGTERCWIAELDGERVGCVFVVRNEDDPSVAQLRCLLVDPAARGHGVGMRLVEECLAFARVAGYGRMMLWTNDVLTAARRIYERCGFMLAEQYAHHSFGHDLVGQVWTKELV
jgi:DNA-binding MarR family transcriptional regulator/GNAT superfamily N-acetyltransferase